MKTNTTAILIMALSCTALAQEKEIEAHATIKSVVIYNSAAEVNYQHELELPEGKSTIVFTDLSPFIIENTIQVSISDPQIDIITTTEKINHIKEQKAQNHKVALLQDSIALIKNEAGLLKCKAEALNQEKILLFKDESIGGVSKGVAVSEIEKASAFFSKRYYEINQELFRLHEKETAIQNRLMRMNNEINSLSQNTQKPHSEIRVTVMSRKSKKASFIFKYLTLQAGWAPAYDFKYQGPNEPLNFVFRANVFNASGTAWDNVDIVLSTASPTNGFNTPSLNTPASNKAYSNGEVHFRILEVTNAIAEYVIKHKYSIPSDSKPYLIDVEAYNIQATYSYLLIPKLDPFGFLMAQIPDWNKYNLIPGTTNIYNKGSFMGKTFLNTYAENDTFSLYLGKDKNIQSIRKETSTNNKQSMMGNYYIDKTSTSLSIKNNSAEKLDIQLLDQVPVFDGDDKVKFSLQGAELALYNKDEGLLTWNFSLNANENKNFDYKYEIREPRNSHHHYSSKKRYRIVASPSF